MRRCCWKEGCICLIMPWGDQSVHVRCACWSLMPRGSCSAELWNRERVIWGVEALQTRSLSAPCSRAKSAALIFHRQIQLWGNRCWTASWNFPFYKKSSCSESTGSEPKCFYWANSRGSWWKGHWYALPQTHYCSLGIFLAALHLDCQQPLQPLQTALKMIKCPRKW